MKSRKIKGRRDYNTGNIGKGEIRRGKKGGRGHECRRQMYRLMHGYVGTCKAVIYLLSMYFRVV